MDQPQDKVSDWDVSKGSDLSRDDGSVTGGSPRGFDRVMAFEGASPSPPSVRQPTNQSINQPDNN